MKVEKMDLVIVVGIVLAIVPAIVCPPVNPNKIEAKVKDAKEAPAEDDGLQLEYDRYLREIMDHLHDDVGFKKSIEEYQKNHNGSEPERNDISRHLEFVSHSVRTKLDEIKRREIDRIKSLMKERVRQQQGKDVDWKSIMPGMDHLDIKNPEAFDVTDLDKLIHQATRDLEDIDKKRREEFKQYELQKEHERREKLSKMDAEHKKKAEEEYVDQKKKHKEHPKLHEPGSKAQLEEVWEKEDHLDKGDFNPRSFFALHDTNNDGFLTADEVEALFNVELQKLYEEGHPEDDMVEKFEEMNRMREKVYKEIDANQDGAISLEEFMNSTKKKDFDHDDGWKPLDEQEPFSEDELKQYETHLKDEGEGEVTEQEQHAPKAAGVVQMDQKVASKLAENAAAPPPTQK
ncbi:nucleobindin-2-like isoform X3 [Lineus longissimus]|uniref:nucleobindin-2-like isoform X3 n=1 Tax=Lineus longissimus TaxID=88925 RepID=UPI00315D1E51